MTDLRIAVDVFLTLAFTEVIAKPVAIRVGRAVLQWADNHVGWVPNWLYKGSNPE
jgi:hypothetical protein